MDRWCGVLKVPLCSDNSTYYRVAASLCLSPTSKTLVVRSVLESHSWIIIFFPNFLFIEAYHLPSLWRLRTRPFWLNESVTWLVQPTRPEFLNKIILWLFFPGAFCKRHIFQWRSCWRDWKFSDREAVRSKDNSWSSGFKIRNFSQCLGYWIFCF